jgi:hypothetical protein
LEWIPKIQSERDRTNVTAVSSKLQGKMGSESTVHFWDAEGVQNIRVTLRENPGKTTVFLFRSVTHWSEYNAVHPEAILHGTI